MDDGDGGRTAGDPRRLLLTRVVDHLSTHGGHDLTLRGIASGVGTSHRMLIYHFATLDGLVAAVVDEVERRQREALVELADDHSASVAAIAARFWKRLRAPDLRPLERLFFELYARGLIRDPQSVGERLVLPWLASVDELLVARGFSQSQAGALARLSQAVTRGLLLDLLATGDETAVDEAMSLHIAHLVALEAAARTRSCPAAGPRPGSPA